MKLSAVANNVYEKASKYTKDVKETLGKTVKPFVKEQYKYAKKISKDTVDFVKKNPKKTGRYAIATLLAASAGAVIVKAVKDFINVKKQNKILKDFVVMQKNSNDELKNVINTQNEIIAGKDAVVEAQKKIIEEQNAKLGENNN